MEYYRTVNKDNLRKLAEAEALRALGLRDRTGIRFEQRGGVSQWDEGVYRNRSEFRFRVWKRLVLYDVELDARTGEVLSWHERISGRNSG
jgi:hypothetical protein